VDCQAQPISGFSRISVQAFLAASTKSANPSVNGVSCDVAGESNWAKALIRKGPGPLAEASGNQLKTPSLACGNCTKALDDRVAKHSRLVALIIRGIGMNMHARTWYCGFNLSQNLHGQVMGLFKLFLAVDLQVEVNEPFGA
jgi:hypothetical protein